MKKFTLNDLIKIEVDETSGDIAFYYRDDDDIFKHELSKKIFRKLSLKEKLQF